tara:strand:+ start:1044 stop:1370 length:327 start_codon:yes stop_codon:yes gene_type:complete
MNSYNYSPSPNVNLIHLNKITLTNQILSALDEKKISYSDSYLIDTKSFDFGKLSRLDSFKNKNDLLPPIKLKKIGVTDSYEIIDGRHRVTSSIIFGYSKIPAIIINDN